MLSNDAGDVHLKAFDGCVSRVHLYVGWLLVCTSMLAGCLHVTICWLVACMQLYVGWLLACNSLLAGCLDATLCGVFVRVTPP
jgi:hypothetical protein